MIYLDNAATTGKKPPSVIRAVERGLRDFSANPGRGGHQFSLRASKQLYGVREKAADFFGASGAETVVFTLNCTHSINCVIKGVTQPGDRVVTSNLEHNAVTRPLYKQGVMVKTVKVSLDDALTVQAFSDAITPDTKLVICTMASNVTGKILPVRKLGALCKARGVPFAVDAAQTAGVLPISMKDMGIDYLCVAPHKGLYAPMGIGLLLCEKPVPNTLIEGGTGVNSVEQVQPDTLPERLESGTVGLPLALGVMAGMDFVDGIGLHKIHRHESALCEMLYQRLSHMPGVVLYTPEYRPDSFVPVVSFNLQGKTGEETAQLLDRAGIAVRGGLHCAPSAHRALGTLETGTVRVSVSLFNSVADIQNLIRALENVNKS